MKKIVLFMLMLMSVLLAFAQWQEQGEIVSDIVIGEGTYQITGDLTLMQGVNLTINGDVEIQVTGEYWFRVDGNLVTNADQITFTGTNWNGLRFYNQPAGTTVSNIEIHDAIHNTRNLSGGGLYLENCNFTMENILIDNAKSNRYGGGIYMKNSNPIMNEVTVSNCEASWDGGGIYLLESSPTFYYGLVISNKSLTATGGGLAAFNNSSPAIHKSTFSGNSANSYGAAIAALYTTNVTIKNSIIWWNYINDGLSNYPEIYKVASAIVNPSYSLMRNCSEQSFFNENNSLDEDPKFDISSTTGYELLIDSPCIDTGDPAPQNNDPDNTRADMGRFYFAQSGLRGSVGIADAAQSLASFDEVRILIYKHPNVGTLIGTELLDSQGRFKSTLIYNNIEYGAGLYRVKCVIDNPLVGPYPSIIDSVLVVENQLNNIDPDVNTPSFMINEIPDVNVRGTVRIANTDLWDPLHSSIRVSSSETNDVAFAYPLYYAGTDDIIEWRYQLPVPQGIEMTITLSLDGYIPVSYDVGPLVDHVDWETAPHIVMNIVPFWGTLSGKIKVEQDPPYFTLPVVDMEDFEIAIDDVVVQPDQFIQLGTHEFSYVVDNVQTGTRRVSVDHPDLAKVVRRNVNIIANSETQNINFRLLPWVPISGTQFVMTAYATTSLDGTFFQGKRSNMIGAFKASDPSVCMGVGVWHEDNHPYWLSEVYYYDLPGYWYFTIVSDASENVPIIFKAFHDPDDWETPGNFYDFDKGFESLTFYDNTEHNPEIEDETRYDVNLVDYSQSYELSYNLMHYSPSLSWSWISFPYYMDSYNVNDVFDSVMDENLNSGIHQIQSQDALGQIISETWDGALWAPEPNYLVDIYRTYKVRMLSSETLTIQGYKINPVIHPVYLHYKLPDVWDPFLQDWVEVEADPAYRWYWISYLNPEGVALPLETALASISLKSIKTQNKSAVYNEGTWIGDLTHMEVGKGYLVDIDANSWLSYPGIGDYSRDYSVPFEHANPAKWELISGNTTNMVLLADLGVSDTYQAGVFDVDGNCVSIGKYENGFWYFTVLGNQTEELLHVRLYDLRTGKTIISENSFEYKANTLLGEVNNPLSFSFQLEDPEDITPVTVPSLAQNYPNPFNPSTKISYSIPNEAEVKLQVYNIKGQLVETLVNEKQNANQYEINWEASQYGTGIYFYKLSINGKVHEVKKCIMLK